MPKISAGILLYRHTPTGLEVLLVHPGGPFWAQRDLGAWSIPKGEADQEENLLCAAQREFHEETGFTIQGTAIPLGHVRQSGGKIVHAWAINGDVDPKQLRSNTFEIEWPPKSKMIRSFQEVDKAEWFTPAEAHLRIISAQAAFLDALVTELKPSTQK